MSAIQEEKERTLPATIALATEQCMSLNVLNSDDKACQQEIEKYKQAIKALEDKMKETDKLRQDILINVAKANELPIESMSQYVCSNKELVKAGK
jgi:hypothetical protein